MILAHVAGIPVEETLLNFAPVGVVVASIASWRCRAVLRPRHAPRPAHVAGAALRRRSPAARRASSRRRLRSTPTT
jgi:hypothetical protein